MVVRPVSPSRVGLGMGASGRSGRPTQRSVPRGVRERQHLAGDRDGDSVAGYQHTAGPEACPHDKRVR